MKRKRYMALSEERTILAEERNVYSHIRTICAILGVIIILAKLFDLISWWPILLISGLFISVVLGEDVHKLFKLKKLEKKLREETQV